ncbi:MAG: solute:Na+ symporter, family [Chthoniobacter sp.]|jgi:Na+/proline symporter|nr:solute:Na+ symporter, family [Chthoniobacter sp.]
MLIFGLHILDVLVILFFLGLVLGLGWWASRSVKEEKDFYLGGRSFGKVLQFFLNFGNMTDSSGAPTTSAEVFRTGAGGIWIALQTLFITPFFWFSTVWYRRARVVTMADLVFERFRSKSLVSFYVAFNVYVSLLLLAFGNVASYKVAKAMIVKPPQEYSEANKTSVQEYAEYSQLKTQSSTGRLSPEHSERFHVLDSKKTRGEINSFVSYFDFSWGVSGRTWFFIGYTLIVAIYITLGGLKAAAVTDALQGLLILAFTVMMIPMGLMSIGGFKGLHQGAPEFMFHLFGTVAASDYAWYSILAITFTSMIQIFGMFNNMSNAGSAKDENTARFGQLAGAFTKRFVIIAWMLCGLIAVVMFPGGLSDPENAWGQMATKLLMPGLLGLMISGILLGHMPAVGSYAISIAALIGRNLYEPFVTGKSKEHYLKVGQFLVLATLATSVVISANAAGAVKLITTVITVNAFPGAVVLLIFFWRKLSAPAVWISFVLWIVLIGIVPTVAPKFESLRRSPSFLVQNQERSIEAIAGATEQDVTAGRAAKVGDSISKPYIIQPVPVFYESIARINPSDPAAPMEGVGRFQVETYMLHLIGVPVQNFNKAGILAARWGVDGILPFVMLMLFSYLFPDRRLGADAQRRLDGFFAKMKTPVATPPEADEREVALSYEKPDRFDYKKLFPGTNWEFSKWTPSDFLGFFGCWVIVLLILGMLWLLLQLGK